MFKFLYIIVILLLSSCGFQPLYNNDATKELAFIEIHDTNTILNVKMNQELSRLLYLQNRATKAKYILDVNVTCKYLDNVILSNSDIIEQTIDMKIDYHLKDKKSDATLVRSTFNVADQLNNSVALYAASVNAEKTKNQLIDSAAKQIEQELILFFLKNNETIPK